MVCLLDLASMELFLQSPFPPSTAFLVSAKTSYGCDEVLRSICDMDESSSFGLSIFGISAAKTWRKPEHFYDYRSLWSLLVTSLLWTNGQYAPRWSPLGVLIVKEP